MLESLFFFVCEHVHFAPWILFVLLLLTGLCIPISEDLLLLSGGAIASTCLQEHALELYLWLFTGSLFAAWEAYWIGRHFGPRLYKIRLFKTIVTPNRLQTLRYYYAKFGVFTFVFGRFCPGGIRNALFMSSGLSNVSFYHFILRDTPACIISTLSFFFLGYKFGQHFDLLMNSFDHYTHWFFIVFFFSALAPLLAVGCGYWRIAARKTFYVGRSEAASERRGARREDISGDCGGGLGDAANCRVGFASDCKSL